MSSSVGIMAKTQYMESHKIHVPNHQADLCLDITVPGPPGPCPWGHRTSACGAMRRRKMVPFGEGIIPRDPPTWQFYHVLYIPYHQKSPSYLAPSFATLLGTSQCNDCRLAARSVVPTPARKRRRRLARCLRCPKLRNTPVVFTKQGTVRVQFFCT